MSPIRIPPFFVLVTGAASALVDDLDAAATVDWTDTGHTHISRKTVARRTY